MNRQFFHWKKLWTNKSIYIIVLLHWKCKVNIIQNIIYHYLYFLKKEISAAIQEQALPYTASASINGYNLSVHFIDIDGKYTKNMQFFDLIFLLWGSCL